MKLRGEHMMNYIDIFDLYEKTLNECYMANQDSLQCKQGLLQFKNIENEIVKYLEYNEQTILRMYSLKDWIENQQPVILFFDKAVIDTVFSDFWIGPITEQKEKVLLQKTKDAISLIKSCIIDEFVLFALVQGSIAELNGQKDQTLNQKTYSIYNKYIEKPTNYLNTPIFEICCDIANSETIGQVWEKYRYHKDDLHEITFFFSNNQERDDFVPVDLYRIFDEIPQVKTNLFSLFCFGKVNYFSRATLINSRTKGFSERLISFDKNAISYFRTMLQGKKDRLPSVAQSNIDVLIKSINGQWRWQFDYIPYIVEDRLSKNYNEKMVLETLYEIEKYYYKSSNKSDVFCLNEAKRQIDLTEQILEIYRERFYHIYCMLLTVCFVQLKYTSLSAEQKLDLLFDLFDIDVYELYEPIITLAYDFYKGIDGKYFFRKVQITTKNVTNQIKNMAWDIFHLKCLEWNYGIHETFSDGIFSYFCTYDSGILKELRKYFELDALAVCARTKEFFPFYHYDNLPITKKNIYFSKQALIYRKEMQKKCDFEKIIQKYEQELNHQNS